jgi:rod shape-determining protein MreD
LIKGKCANNLSLEPLDLDIIVILTGYIFLFYGSANTALFAFGQGFVIDIFSGGPQGIFAFTYFSIYLIFFIGSRLFNINEPKGQFFLVFMAVGYKKIFLGLIFWASSSYFDLSVSVIWLSALSALITALAAPIVFLIFNNLKKSLGFRKEA